MKILGIDTSSKVLSIGASDGEEVCGFSLEVGRKLSQLITISIARVLEALGWQAQDVDYFACGLGPGSFTGLRTGVATIKGMSWALKRPVAGISSLDILAASVSSSDRLIIPAIDAKRSLIYSSIYKNEKGSLKRIAPYMLLDKAKFLAKLKPGCVILGDALEVYKEDILRNARGVDLLEKDHWYPKPHNIIRLAKEMIREKSTVNSFDLNPFYLYPKECQIRKIK